MRFFPIVAILALMMSLPASSKFCRTTVAPKNFLDGLYRAACAEAKDWLDAQESGGKIQPRTLGRPPIPVYFHIMDDFSRHWITENVYVSQFEYLRDFFSAIGFTFELKKIFYYHEPGWSMGSDDAQLDMMQQLRVGNYETLNIFIVEGLNGNRKDLGLSSLPEDYVEWTSKAFKEDGIRLTFRVLPSWTSDPNYNEGKTLLHEVGHWLGLLHPFYNGCHPDFLLGGDKVPDTPPQAYQFTTCFKPGTEIQSCPRLLGFPPNLIDNMMDYLPDRCKTGFTQGQINRMEYA
ncbi:hypothetical protein IWZ00DRAFT_490921 [Phyllosticta capitalensis]|uniref:uncharacterized protein n=1 Tax=Phyllosticta capitalensis TaxID=121624 RepID=UPI00312F57C1